MNYSTCTPFNWILFPHSLLFTLPTRCHGVDPLSFDFLLFPSFDWIVSFWTTALVVGEVAREKMLDKDTYTEVRRERWKMIGFAL